jgi:hypothetical protein
MLEERADVVESDPKASYIFFNDIQSNKHQSHINRAMPRDHYHYKIHYYKNTRVSSNIYWSYNFEFLSPSYLDCAFPFFRL